MEFKKLLLCSIIVLSLNAMDEEQISIDQSTDTIQLSEEDANAQAQQLQQLLQQITLLTVVDFFEINAQMVSTILKEGFRDVTKIERLISKQVKQYIDIHAPKLLTSIAQQLGMTEQKEIQFFIQNTLPLIQEMLPIEVQKYLFIEQKIYKQLYAGQIRMKKATN